MTVIAPDKYTRFEDCPDAARLHTKQPAGYVDRSEWAFAKLRTHNQERCPTCGFWSVWKRKVRTRLAYQAIRILGEAARTDGQVLMAAQRLGLYPTKASAMALQAFYADEVQDAWPRQQEACGAAEALMREGWTP